SRKQEKQTSSSIGIPSQTSQQMNNHDIKTFLIFKRKNLTQDKKQDHIAEVMGSEVVKAEEASEEDHRRSCIAFFVEKIKVTPVS
ncbi:hypothetical protein, partial [Klebsiella pneumoniae]|uniref:hypothetical protein n=1 Tax=Klebsiella pneumoniae TaxID=573 RepID=UPI0024DE51C7